MFGLSKYVMIGLSASLILLGGVFYLYYNSSQNTISTLNKNNAKLETAVEIQKQTINSMEKQRDLQAKNIIELSRGLEKAELEKEELRKKLNRHDLERIGRAKAGLLEKAINDGTDKAFEDLENETSNNR
jgi:hypothetical protein